MIENFYAYNYKSFVNFKLDIANINILLGSNSCGKSSIANLLLMLSQTADSVHSYDSIFRLNSSKSSLGEAINIFPDKKEDKQITIGWSIDNLVVSNKFTILSIPILCDLFDTHVREITRTIRRYFWNKAHEREDRIEQFLEKLNFASEKIANNFQYDMHGNEFGWSEELEENILRQIRVVNKTIKEFQNEYYELRDVTPISPIRFKELFSVLKEREKLDEHDTLSKKIEYTIAFNSNLNECELRGFKLYNNKGKCLVYISLNDSGKISVSSEVYPNEYLKSSRLDIVRGMNTSSLILLKDRGFDFYGGNPFSNLIRQVIAGSSKLFVQELSGAKINHVSPLRAFPQRYYLLEKSAMHNTLNANDGSQLAEILKNNPSVTEKVNAYFKDFDIKISTAKTNDIIHRITVKQNNVTMELTDVGFGISQVLPILVQAILCPKDSITIIEQPEIHLHPKMQAWLTNALVKISVNDNKKFIIETHSETIIKRLQLLLLDPSVNFDKEMLHLYHLERNDKGNTTLSDVEFDDSGEIAWPHGFMDQEIQDAIKLQEFRVKKLRESRGL